MEEQELVVANSSKAVAYYCDCPGPHRSDCYLGHRLKIKHNEISHEDFVKDPEKCEAWIDKELEKRIKEGLINVKGTYGR